MQYLFLLYEDEAHFGALSDDERGKLFGAFEEFNAMAEKAGVLRAGHALQPTATATTLRVRRGNRDITDGPFAETKEQLGGYYLLDCKDLDEALAWAEKLPTCKTGSIEVRPVIEM